MSNTIQSDTDYLQGIRTGDPAVLHRIYEDWFPRILHLIRSNSGGEEDARDIFQEGIIILYQKASDPDFRLTSSLFTFLYAICRNLWLKKLRKKDRDRVTLDDDMVFIDEAPEIREEELRLHGQYELYRRKFRKLGEQCRRLLELSLAGKRVREIVALMGFSSEQYARKRKFNCKQKLVRMIREDEGYESLADAGNDDRL